jgi:hypothetical protein
MKLFVTALAGLIISGCAQTPTATASPVASPMTSGQASASPVASPMTNGQASPSPVIDRPLSRIGLACRLPLTMYVAGGDSATYRGGFITFPQAGYQLDPAGVITNEDLAGGFVTAATPVLHGTLQTGPPFYDLARKRWVPAGAGQSSPDGSSYAFGVLNGSNPGAPLAIHVVTIASGADHVFTVSTTPDFGGAVGAWVGDFDGSSVYFSSQQQMGPPMGVWRLDVASGTVHQLSKEFGVAAIRGSDVWLTRIDPRDPEGPLTGRSGPRANSVVRVDLSTGQETVWYFAAGHQVSLEGIDSLGAPIISDAPPPNFTHAAVRLVSKPASAGIAIYDGVDGLGFWAVQSDISGRLWLGNDFGIYLWTPAVGLQKVYAYSSDTMAEAHEVLPSGRCT